MKATAKLDLGDYLPYLTNRVGMIVAEQFGEDALAAHGLSIVMWRVMAVLASHGSQDMPVWGPLFSSISQGHEAQVQQRTANLVSYIETLQAK